MKEKPFANKKPKRAESGEKTAFRKRNSTTTSATKKSASPRTTKKPVEKTVVKKVEKKSTKQIVRIEEQDAFQDKDSMRLNRYLAHAGIAARRKADVLIASGHVTVNGEVMKEMGHRVKPTDVVKFQGKIVKPKTNFVYILLNKPKDHITTSSDEKGRKTVMELIASATEERVFPVGRLDRNTTGLLLLTNDGDLAQKLAHPSFEVKKIYHVVLDKPFTKEHFDELKKGVKLEDGDAKVNDIGFPNPHDSREVGVEIHIGKNRIVRRMFEHLGYHVEALDRVMYAGLTKKDLPRKRWRMLTPVEVMQLKNLK